MCALYHTAALAATVRLCYNCAMEERLQNILSHRGVASRRGAAAMIEEGRVSVNGAVVREPGARFDPSTAEIAVDGRPVGAATERTRTIMMYKPAGVLSTVSDPFGGRTVLDLVRGQVSERLVPVGRLDKDSEGLLVMTNDGDLALRLSHPRYGHTKTYRVRVAGKWTAGKLDILRGRVEMPDGYLTHPAKVDAVRFLPGNVAELEFVLGEGRKRQIRYMCSAAHLAVLDLKRVAIGRYVLPSSLKPGEWLELSPADIAMLG